MERHVNVRRIGIQGSAEHQDGFAMGVVSFSDERDIGGERNIAGHSFPDELEAIRGGPHILAAAGDGVRVRGGVIFDAAGMVNRADVGMIFEEADGMGILGRGLARSYGEEQERARDDDRRRNFVRMHS